MADEKEKKEEERKEKKRERKEEREERREERWENAANYDDVLDKEVLEPGAEKYISDREHRED